MKYINIVAVVLALLFVGGNVFAQDMTPSVTVVDQVSVDGSVTVAGVYATAPAFIVIHKANDEGGVGPVIGYRQVNVGSSNNVKVWIDASQATTTMFAMLHDDTGAVGVYEFGTVEGADTPVIVDGAPVTPGFAVETVRAYDQFVADSTVTIASVVTAQNGFIVIHSDNGGTPGPVLGYALVTAGSNNDVAVTLEGDVTDVVWPMLHVDTGAAGTYEFGTVEGADGPVRINGAVAMNWITVGHPAIRVNDQIVLHGDGMPMMEGMAMTVTAASVLSEGPGWLVIHADNEGAPGPVLGATQVADGTNMNVVVELTAEGVTPVLWPMLHVDTGAAGVYEFGTVEGADGPVRVGDNVVMLPINAAPSIDLTGTLTGTTLWVAGALVDGQAWLAIHSDNAGQPGPVIGTAPLIPGWNGGITVELSEAPATGTVFPMLHYDTGAPGVYEFGTVEGADAPVFVGENVIFGALTPTAGE
jgi:hypothetical protein